MTDEHFRDDIVESYELKDEEEYMLITYDDRGYKLEHKRCRSCATDTITSGVENLADVKQILLAQAERMDRDQLKQQVLEGEQPSTYITTENLEKDSLPVYIDREKVLDEVRDQ